MNRRAQFCVRNYKFIQWIEPSDPPSRWIKPSLTHEPQHDPGLWAEAWPPMLWAPKSQLTIDTTAQIHSTVLSQPFRFLASNISVQQQTALSDCQCQHSIPELPNRHKDRTASTCKFSIRLLPFQIMLSTSESNDDRHTSNWHRYLLAVPASQAYVEVRTIYQLRGILTADH
jgi:hypothetical protein